MLDGFIGFMIGSTLWFWIIILIELLALFYYVERERSGWALMSVLITLGILSYMFDFGVLTYIKADPFMSLVWVAGYIVAGILYALLRWDRKGAKWRHRYDSGTAEEKKTSLRYRPQASKSKNKIITWMIYWPISGAWWLFSDFVHQLFSSIYRRLTTVLERISARHTRGIDLTKADEDDSYVARNRR